MRARLPLWASQLAGIVSSLVLHLRKGYGGGYAVHTPNRIALLETSFRYLGESARHFHESLQWLRRGLAYAALYVRIHPSCVLARLRGGLVRVVRRSLGQTSHFRKHSCPPEDTCNKGLSNGKKVDASGSLPDSLGRCLDSRNCGSIGEKISKLQGGNSP